MISFEVIRSFWPKKPKWVLYWALFDPNTYELWSTRDHFLFRALFIFCDYQNSITFKQNGKLELNVEFLLCGPIQSFKIAWSSLDFSNFDQQYFSEVLYLTKLWFLKPKDTKSQEKRKVDEINEIIPVQCSKWFSSWHELTKQSPKNLKYLKL